MQHREDVEQILASLLCNCQVLQQKLNKYLVLWQRAFEVIEVEFAWSRFEFDQDKTGINVAVNAFLHSIL